MVNHEDRAYRYTVPRNNSLGFFLKRTLSLSLSPFRAPRRDHRQLRFTLDEPRTCQINGTGSHVNYERKPRRIVSETTARHRDTRASAYRFGDREYRDLNKLSPSLSLSLRRLITLAVPGKESSNLRRQSCASMHPRIEGASRAQTR